MQGAKQARAQADARLDEVLAGLGFEGWLLGRLDLPTEIGVCHGKRAEARCDTATNRLKPVFRSRRRFQPMPASQAKARAAAKQATEAFSRDSIESAPTRRSLSGSARRIWTRTCSSMAGLCL